MIERRIRRSDYVFAILLIASIGSSLLQTALTTALPAIMSDFQIDAASAQWLTSGYGLAMGIMVPASAFMMKRYSTRSLFLGAAMLFISGTLLSLIATNFSILMVSRILQALATGILLPMTQVVILTIYPMEKRGTMMGIYGLAAGAAPVVAPTIAGMMIDLWNWQSIFLLVLVIIVIDFVLAYRYMENLTETEKLKFDTTSMMLCTIGFSSILLGLGNLSNASMASLFVPLSLGCVSLWLFTKRQLHSEVPFLDVTVLKHKNYRIAVIISMLMYSIMMGGSTIFPLYIQTILGKSATISGLIMMPGSFLMALINPFTGKFYDRFGIRKLLIGGSFLLLFSCIGVVFVDEFTNVYYLAFCYILRLLAIGCIMMPIVTWGMKGLGVDDTAHGTALLTSLRTISGAFGAAIFVMIMSMAGGGVKGVDVSFFAMSIFALIQFVGAWIWVEHKKSYAER